MDNLFFSAAAGERKALFLEFNEPGAHTITLDLTEPNSHIELRGAYTLTGDAKLLLTIIQKHTAPGTKSAVLIKGLAYDQTQVHYHGTIILSKDAQQSEASQFNKNLLLGEKAVVRSSPNLEIHNNKVQCKHGSAVGKLDPISLFYLASRGLTDMTSRQMLIDAFMIDAI